MRRNYISPEYTYNNVYGTFNMVEESSFFGSKMLQISDSILVDNNSLIYCENLNNEQLDLKIESTLPSIIYDPSVDKLSNSTLSIATQSQSTYQLSNQTVWNLNINLNQILTNYIFATLKQNRTFEGISNNMTSNNSVDFAINEYISNNILNRYQYSGITMYLTYNSLTASNTLKYQNTWTPSIISDSNLLNGLKTTTSYNYSTLTGTFTQLQPSSGFSFNYYFNLLFNRI